MTYIDKGVDPLADEVVRLHGSAKRKAAAHAQTQRHPRSRKAALDRANLQAGLHAAPQTPKPLLKPHLPQPTIAHAHTLHTHTHTYTQKQQSQTHNDRTNTNTHTTNMRKNQTCSKRVPTFAVTSMRVQGDAPSFRGISRTFG